MLGTTSGQLSILFERLFDRNMKTSYNFQIFEIADLAHPLVCRLSRKLLLWPRAWWGARSIRVGHTTKVTAP